MKFLELLSFLLVLFHSPEGSSASRIRCSDRERQALLKFKDELVDAHGRFSSWGNQENKRDCCKWRGVNCHNRTNHVTRLNLRNELGYDGRLKGMISPSLLELRQLQYLDLSYNHFDYAPIPEFIGSLTELRYLNLRDAYFGGPIPDHLGNLSRLSYLDLSSNGNSYSESLDWVSHLHSLEHLDLSSTNLSMATNWLQAINSLTSIKELHLESCELPDIPSSSLPSNINASAPLSILDLSYNSLIFSPLTLIRWFSNFSHTGLTSIRVRGNNMSGPISDVFANMVSLAHLDLYGTGLEGGIPKYFGNMSSLVDINLSGNNLTGELPDLMMNLSGYIENKLQFLYLSENAISGSFPNMSRFSSLRELTLRANQLKGSIKEGYLKLPRLFRLDLSQNQLTGQLPDLSFSSSLEFLFLFNNNFNGTLTESSGRLSNLSRLLGLDLSLNPSLMVKLSPHWVPPFQLRYLGLRHCRLGPQFPLWLKTQKTLSYIDISSAGISDSIPSWFGGVTLDLLYLNTSNNKIAGEFPDFSFRTSRDSFDMSMRLDLSRNNISGSINFLCHTRDQLELLDLSDNHLFGNIPDCFSHFERLRYLNLANNNFSGKMPHSFGSLITLSLLNLRNNSFSGDLPTSMANCTNLVMIDAGENRLTGKIPAWIGDRLLKLKVLILRFNEFYDNIPSNVCGLANMQVLDLSSNKISGVIPNCVHKYMAMTQKKNDNTLLTIGQVILFEYPITERYVSESAYFMWKGNEVNYVNNLGLVKLIDLSSNNLVGQIPFEITKLVGLVGLNFSTNNLFGSIPRDIGQLQSLNFLDFSRNQLSGSIPASLGELSFLGVLNLSYNNLFGRIPLDNKLLTFDELSYISNPGLCGLPLNKSCLGDESRQDSGSGNTALSKEDNEDEGFISEGFYIALVLGFIVGFWGIFGTILLNKTIQYAFVKVLNIVEDFVSLNVKITKARLLRHFQNG